MQTRRTNKYIIRQDGSVSVGGIVHAWMACGCPESDCGGRAIAAGFFKTEGGKVTVYGESGTLGIRSKPEDAAVLEKYFKENPVY